MVSKTDTLPLTKGNYEILKALLTGKYLRASIDNAKYEQLKKDCGYTNYDPTIKRAEAEGIIVGYVPVLSERGKQLMAAMKVMFGSFDEKDAGLEELMEKVG